MATYEVSDNMMIDAPPATVWAALHAEFQRDTDWWMPYWRAQPRGEIPPGAVGAEYAIVVHPPGWLRQMLLTPRFVARVTDSVEPARFAVEFPEGDFSGTGVWTLSPVGEQTMVRFDWNVTTRGPRATAVGWCIDIGRVHSIVMQEGFKGLSRHLLESRRSPRPTTHTTPGQRPAHN